MKNGYTYCIISRMEKIASGFQFAGSGDSGFNNMHSGHTRLSKFGRPPVALMTN